MFNCRVFPKTHISSYRGFLRIKSDSETSLDCATLIAQLFGRIAQLGLRNLDCATLRIAQLRLRNSPDCATQIAQLHSTDCATLRIAQLCLRNCI